MSKPKLILIAILLAGIIGTGVAGIHRAQDHQATSNLAVVSGGPAVGSLSPDFTLKDLHGQPHRLSEYRGKRVTLAFFCGCDRCHAAAKKIAALERAGSMGPIVSVIALDTDGGKEFMHSTGIRGAVLTDPNETVAQKYVSEFCPRLWQVGPDGKIAYASGIALENGELDSSLRTLSR